MAYPYIYYGKVVWYNDIDKEVMTEEIFFTGYDFKDAMEKVSDYYGEKSLVSVKLYPFDSCVLNVKDIPDYLDEARKE